MRSRGTTTTRGRAATRGSGRTAGVVAVLVLAGGLAACTGDDRAPTPAATSAPVEQTPSPTPTPTPTPTPVDPAAVPPERPSAMDTVDTAGAEAVAQYFLQLVPYAEATGDIAALEALSHEECIFCRSVLDGVDALVAAGLLHSGGLPTFAGVSALEVDAGAWWTVDVDLTQSPIEVLDAAGAVAAPGQPESLSYHMDVAVVFDTKGWRVRALEYEATGTGA